MDWTHKQRACQRRLADPEYDGDRDSLAAELGLRPDTIETWEGTDGFWEEVHRLARIEANRAVPAVWKALLFKARRGDVPAIKLLFSILEQPDKAEAAQGPVQFKFIVENGNGASLTADAPLAAKPPTG